jgi:hypothetical protein
VYRLQVEYGKSHSGLAAWSGLGDYMVVLGKKLKVEVIYPIWVMKFESQMQET